MRKDIDEKKQQVLDMVEAGEPKAYICRFLNCRPETLDRYLRAWSVDYKGRANKRGSDLGYVPHGRLPLEEYIQKKYMTSHMLRVRLLQEGIKQHQCEQCKVTEWNGKLIPLELDHIDGNRFNNNLDNLRTLCPNCHAQTSTYCKPVHKR